MYFRKWTRMHLQPAFKYFSKYGLIDKQFQAFTPMLRMQNPPADHHLPKYKRPINNNWYKKKKQKDVDTKLIEKLFLKYPDLKYEPISKAKYSGKQMNTFSYAFAFITEQKKLIHQGYSIDKAFEITQQKYHKKMQRKVDQTLLSKGLAIGNRARSFLSVYQQHVQYQSKLKMLRTQRQLEKYQYKLQKMKKMVKQQKQENYFIENNIADYERMFIKIVEEQEEETNSEQNSSNINRKQERIEMIQNLKQKFKHLFSQYYQRAAYKDRLQGLTDHQIINEITTKPSKIKKRINKLVSYLNQKGYTTINQSGELIFLKKKDSKLAQLFNSFPYLKTALYNEKIFYQKPTNKKQPIYFYLEKKKQLNEIRQRNYTKQQHKLLMQNKQKQLQFVSSTDIPQNRQAYKILESQQERMLRLQIKYLDVTIRKLILSQQSQKDLDKKKQYQKFKEDTENTLKNALMKFRRVKYRLEKKYFNQSHEQLIFPEHIRLPEMLEMDTDIQFENLLMYLNKSVEQRRLTSLDQANDDRVNQILKPIKIPEFPESQGDKKIQ